MKTRSLFPLVVALGLLASGCKKEVASAQANEADTAVSVTTVDVTPLTVPKRLRLTGGLRGAQQTELAANVAGRVTKTFVERGQTVKKGELLAQVDVSAAALSLAEARIQVETSKTQASISQTDCERYERLRNENLVSDAEYDQVTARCKTAPLQVNAAQARQNLAAKNVGDGMIRAPFAGVVTERFVEVGQYVQAPSRVVALAEVADLRLEFSVPEQYYPLVRPGADVLLRVAAYGKEEFSAKVSHISGAVRDTRDVVVEAAVSNPEYKLIPGMFAEVDLTIGSEELPSIPLAAVFDKNEKKTVLVVSGGLLEQRVVQVATIAGDRVALRSGLKLGEKVVGADVAKFKNGQRVK